MVGCAGCRADLGEVPYEPTERWPVRQQNRKVKQPETTAMRRRARARTLVEHEQGGVTILHAKHGMLAFASQHSQTERHLIERE
jgi:hypothetical protein